MFASIAVIPDDANAKKVQSWDWIPHAGRITTASPVPPMIGLVAGYQWFRIAAGKNEPSIELKPGIELQVEFPAETPLQVFKAMTLDVALAASSEPGYEHLRGAGVFTTTLRRTGRREFSTSLPGAGEYRLRVSRPTGPSNTLTAVPLGRAGAEEITMIVSAEPAEEHRVMLFIDPEIISALAEK